MATVPGPRWIGLPTAALAVVAGAAAPSHLGSLTGAGPWPWLLLLLIAALARRRPAARWLVGALALGAAAAAVRPPPAPATGQVAVRIDQPVWVDGAVQLGPGRWSAPVRDGAGRRWWLVSPAPIAPGDHLQVRGRLIAPGPVRNPGGVDGVALARQRGVEATLAASEVERLGTSPAWPWRWADQQRARWSARIAAVDPGRAGAIVRGAVVGDRSAIPPATDRAWRAAGIYHVLSVSGLHLAVVALLAFALQRRALAALGWPRRWPAARVAAAPTLALATAYTLITGAELATVRALLVVATLVLAEALGRKVRLVDALAAACVLVVVTTPAAVAAPAFQLSFVAAAVLVSLAWCAGVPAVAGLARVVVPARALARAGAVGVVVGRLGHGDHHRLPLRRAVVGRPRRQRRAHPDLRARRDPARPAGPGAGAAGAGAGRVRPGAGMRPGRARRRGRRRAGRRDPAAGGAAPGAAGGGVRGDGVGGRVRAVHRARARAPRRPGRPRCRPGAGPGAGERARRRRPDRDVPRRRPGRRGRGRAADRRGVADRRRRAAGAGQPGQPDRAGAGGGGGAGGARPRSRRPGHRQSSAS